METFHSTTMQSLIGPLFLAASAQGLVALEFDARLPGQQSIRPNPRHLRRESEKEKKRSKFEDSPSLLRPYVSEMEEYFAGKRREFTFPLDLRGTDFQKACWRALLAIPYGETRSYAELPAQSASRTHFAPSVWPTTATPLRLSSPATA